MAELNFDKFFESFKESGIVCHSSKSHNTRLCDYCGGKASLNNSCDGCGAPTHLIATINPTPVFSKKDFRRGRNSTGPR